MTAIFVVVVIAFAFFVFMNVQQRASKSESFSQERDSSKDDEEEEDFINKIVEETAKLKEYNKEWSIRHNYYRELIAKAKEHEKLKQPLEAIVFYEEAYCFAKDDPYFTVNNYAHCINRLVINYRKTKQKDKEIELLASTLETHRDWESPTYDEWNERLAKLL